MGGVGVRWDELWIIELVRDGMDVANQRAAVAFQGRAIPSLKGDP